MEQFYNQGVAEYLDNKFGDNYSSVEPWMRRSNADTEYKCMCEAMDDLMAECCNEEDDEVKGNLVGRIRIQVSNDDEERRNVISFYYEKIQ